MSRVRLFFRSAVRRAAFTMFASMFAVTASGISGSGAARADDLPFWERADAAAAPKKNRVSYASSKKPGQTPGKIQASTKKTTARTSIKKYATASAKKLGGYAEQTEPVRHKKKGVRVAALGKAYYPEEKPKKSLSGGGVNWTASSGCLDPGLKAIIYQVASNFGALRVNSTCRSRGHNRSVGGAPKSKHLSGDAVDFRVFGNVRAVYAYLRSNGSVGGFKHYGGGLFHIDNGERRTW